MSERKYGLGQGEAATSPEVRRQVRWTFRAKLIAIVVVAAASSLLVLFISNVFGRRTHDQLVTIRDRYIPQMELGPQLETRFDALRRGLQDAVAANDPEALIATHELEARLLDRLATARGTMDPEVSANARAAISAYYATAYDVSHRLIEGVSGEETEAAIRRMQERHASAAETLRRATLFDRARLIDAFSDALRAEETANVARHAVSALGILLVLLCSLWLTRGVLRSLSTLTEGLTRFGRGEFATKVQLHGNDELSDVAGQANQMAENLLRLATLRDRTDWLKNGIEGLSSDLRGELEPEEAAARAVRFLSSRIGALFGAAYLTDGGLSLKASPLLPLGKVSTPVEPPREFRMGEGIVGQAAMADDVVVVTDAPEGYSRVTSASGDSAPRSLVFLPLSRQGLVAGVLEFAFFASCSDASVELLRSVRELVTITLESASSRAALRELLEETRAQAERLAVQEEELRKNNEELVVQQRGLKEANQALDTQHRVLALRNTELEDARKSVQDKADELAKVSAYKSQFLANMSHELRTPLNSMLLLSQLLSANESQNLTAKQVEYCKTVHGAGKDLLALINQILDLAKIEAGRQEIYVEAVSLADIAARAEGVFRPLASDKGLALTVEVGDGLPDTIATDRHRVDRIVTNLLGNAIKFTERGEVTLRIARPARTTVLQGNALPPGQTIAFIVSDTGIGIPADAIDRVFAPFEQLEARTDRKYGGSGLGLAISRESAILLGGELRVESTPGKGSVFTCYLPEVSAPLSIDVTPESAPVRSGHQAQPTREAVEIADDRQRLDPSSPHLLVIEDDHVMAEQLVELIHEGGLKALVASTGEEGLQLAQKHRPQGIILDIRLPDLDGFKVMDRLKGDPLTSTIPVYFVSGVDTPERGFSVGAVGFLTKPASRADLTAVVRTLSHASATRPRVTLVVEDGMVTAESIVRLLRNEDMEAHHVASAGAAVEALRRERYGCMVLDLGLPDMDGLGLLEILNTDPHIDTPPVIVYTARSLTRAEMRRLDAYVEAVVLKDGSSEARLLETIQLFGGHLEDAPPKKQAIPQSPHACASLRGRKILLADDDMRTVYAVSAVLHGKGAEVIVAENGKEALEHLGRHPDASAVLMDIMMPEMDGYEAMRRLRGDERFARLPVIALTAKAMKGERQRCLDAGASEYLPKPFNVDELLEMLERCLDAVPAKAPGGVLGERETRFVLEEKRGRA